MIRLHRSHLLLQLIAEGPVLPDVAKIREQRARGNQQAHQENQPAALLGEASHLSEADGDEEGSQSRQDREGRERVAVQDWFLNEPRRRDRRDNCNAPGDIDAGAFRRLAAGLLLNAERRTLNAVFQNPPFPMSMLAGSGLRSSM